MRIAYKEMGVTEIPGVKDHPRIREYHAATRGIGRFGDQTAWCSSFANYCFQQSGIAGTRSKAARSWCKWGVPIADPVPGCVVVFWRVAKFSPFGHVAFYVSETDDGRVLALGGNQGNRVSIAAYPRKRVLGFRMPP